MNVWPRDRTVEPSEKRRQEWRPFPTAFARWHKELKLGPFEGYRHAWLVRALVQSSALSVVLMRATFGPGYLVQIDALFGPRVPPMPEGFLFLPWMLERVSTTVIGGAVTGRLYLFCVLFLAAFLPMIILRRSAAGAQIVGGLLGALNPWVYDRLVEGQWTVIAACEGLFLWLICWDLLIKKPIWRREIYLAIAGLVVISFSANFVGILLLLAMASFIADRVWQRRHELRAVIQAAGLTALLLVPGTTLFFSGRGDASEAFLSSVTKADLNFFRAAGAPHFGLSDLFGLYGYWGERLGRFPVATRDQWWVASSALLIVLAIYAAGASRRNAALLIAGYMGVMASALTATHIGQMIFIRLANGFPLVRGYREPEKWSALWLIALVILCGGALDSVRHLNRRIYPAILALITVATLTPAGYLELAATPTIVHPIEFPNDWYVARNYLVALEKPQTKIAALPWHLYEVFPFSHGRLIENPVESFFPGRVVESASNDIPGNAIPRSSPAWAESRGDPACVLLTELRQMNVSIAIVEPAVGGSSDIANLEACGPRVVYQGPSIALISIGPLPG